MSLWSTGMGGSSRRTRFSSLLSEILLRMSPSVFLSVCVCLSPSLSLSLSPVLSEIQIPSFGSDLKCYAPLVMPSCFQLLNLHSCFIKAHEMIIGAWLKTISLMNIFLLRREKRGGPLFGGLALMIQYVCFLMHQHIYILLFCPTIYWSSFPQPLSNLCFLCFITGLRGAEMWLLLKGAIVMCLYIFCVLK